MDILKRFKNPWFVIGLVGLFFTSTRIDPTTLTSWGAVKDVLMGFIGNPFLIGTFIIALIGQFINPTTPGIKD